MKYAKTITKYLDDSKKIKLCYNKILHDYEISISLLKMYILEYKQLKKIIKYISLCEINLCESINSICCVCLDEIEDNNIILSCGHNYHFNCLLDTLKYNNKCCLCRKTVKTTSIDKIKSKNELILDFIILLNENLQKIEKFHISIINKINYYENKKKEYIFNIFNYFIYNNINNKIIKLKKILFDFNIINYIGIKKIIKKLMKKTGVFINIEKINNMNFYKYIINNSENII